MDQISEKELSALNELLSEEELLIKKFKMLAEHSQDAEVKSTFTEISNKRQVKGGVHQHQPQPGVNKPHLVHHGIQRDNDNNRGKHLAHQHQIVDLLLTVKVQTGKCVGRRNGHNHDKQDCHSRNHKAGLKAAYDLHLPENLGVIFKCKHFWEPRHRHGKHVISLF